MNIEEIDIKDIEFGEPIEEKEPTYRDGYIRGIYRARNIIDSKQKEIERLNNIIDKQDKDITTLTKCKIKLKYIINELEKWLDENINNDGLSIYASEQYEEVLDKLQELKGSDKE